MPISRDDIKRFLKKDWDPTWDAILDEIIQAVEKYFQDWLGWAWEKTVNEEKVKFKRFVGRVENPIKTLVAIKKDKGGSSLDLNNFMFSDFLIYDLEMVYNDDELYVDYISVDIPAPIKHELIKVIASEFDRIYNLTYDKDAKVIDSGGLRINERYLDMYTEAKERLEIYKKIYV